MEFVKSLVGGKRNVVDLYKYGRQFVVKKKFLGRPNFDFYTCEKNALKVLKDTGLVPQLIDNDDENQSLFMEYIVGEHLSERNFNLIDLSESFLRLHSVTPTCDKSLLFKREPLCDLEDIFIIFSKHGYQLPVELMREYRELFSDDIITNNSFIHGSCIPSNVLVTDSGPKYIDFEMASFNNPFFDIAYLGAHIGRLFALNLFERYVDMARLDRKFAEKAFDYARFHLCALNLGLFMHSLEDSTFLIRAQKLKKMLSYNFFSDSKTFYISLFFSKLSIRVTKNEI